MLIHRSGCLRKADLHVRSPENWRDFTAAFCGIAGCRFIKDLMCGTKANIVTAVEIQGRHTNDSKLLPALATATADNFTMKEVSADKGYASKDNAEAITALGATPFISFASHHRGNGTGAWRKMYHYFQFKREDFLAHYHKRSNVESTFSMMKRKFGDSIRGKTDTAMVNEVLCKVLCHNLVVLIHEMYELGIDPVFWSNQTSRVN